MRRQIRLVAGIALTCLFAASGAYADGTEQHKGFVKVSDFSGHIIFCAPPSDPIDVVVLPGGIELVTFQNIGNVWRTGNPLVDGTEKNQVTVKFDPASPTIEAKIKGKVDVAALDGKWKFRQFLTAGPDGEYSYGIGFGRGDLHGAMILFETSAGEPVEDSPCGVPFGVPLKGKVIKFGWTG